MKTEGFPGWASARRSPQTKTAKLVSADTTAAIEKVARIERRNAGRSEVASTGISNR